MMLTRRAVLSGGLALTVMGLTETGARAREHTSIDHPSHYIPDANPSDAIALTFDDGPNGRDTERMLDVLAGHQVTATFFLVGARIRRQPGLVRRIHREGHVIGNHSLTHPRDFGSMSVDQLSHEIDTTSDLIEETTGRRPHLFRAPYGLWSDNLDEVLEARGMPPIGWSVDPMDWTLPGVPVLLDRILIEERDAIILCHDGGGDRSQTVEAVDQAIPILRDAGAVFVH